MSIDLTFDEFLDAVPHQLDKSKTSLELKRDIYNQLVEHDIIYKPSVYRLSYKYDTDPVHQSELDDRAEALDYISRLVINPTNIKWITLVEVRGSVETIIQEIHNYPEED